TGRGAVALVSRNEPWSVDVNAWWRSFFGGISETEPGAATVDDVNRLRVEYERLDDDALGVAAGPAATLPQAVAPAAVAAERVLGQRMFDVQIQGSLALASGRIAEMQTGEGKTLAAVPAVVWHARRREGVHVLTANDYLARRDADWMRGIYARLGLSVGV